MKLLVLSLALLAALKVGLHEYLYRTSAAEVIISAYRERAELACQSMSGPQLAAGAWQTPLDVSLAVGRSSLDVRLWQFHHADWKARFRSLHLVMSTGDGGREATCEYDLAAGQASVVMR